MKFSKRNLVDVSLPLLQEDLSVLVSLLQPSIPIHERPEVLLNIRITRSSVK
jgi:hypothetical protein